MNIDSTNERLMGILSATGAYILWGVLPVYWKLVYHVPPQAILAHRILWSFLFMVAVLLTVGKFKESWNELRHTFTHPLKLIGIVLASFLISINWLTYIWAVNNDRIIETSLGYYINPLVSVMLGIMVLKEKLSFWQVVAVILAVAGVLNMTLHFGSVPWVALCLAFSFGMYGLIKKIIVLGALTGITVETGLITPVALLYLWHISGVQGALVGLETPVTAGLMAGAGIITAVPLILFAAGARRLPLSAIGFLQYIAPTLALVIGVFVYHEPFTRVHLVSFLLIWSALTVFSLSNTKLLTRLEPGFMKKAAIKGKEVS